MSKVDCPGSTPGPLPMLCGADIELGNFIVGPALTSDTGYRAARALLAKISGLPLRPNIYYLFGHGGQSTGAKSPASSPAPPRVGVSMSTRSGNSIVLSTLDPTDVSRRFLASNGGCAYIDLDHVEICLPEVSNAFDHVAAWHAMLRIVRRALEAANEGQPAGQRIKVLVNNSDGLGNSYGSHVNFLIRRRTWDNIFRRKVHYLPYLASFQVSSIILTGQGKVGAENDQPPVAYQISQRADFFSTLVGPQTTYDRPIVNSRDEPLCGSAECNDPAAPARLHCIFFDSSLAHGSSLFRVGLPQLVLTLIELGLVSHRLILEDPLEALHAYSRDPTLTARAELISGEYLTALELQMAFLEEVRRYAAQGVFDGVVPRAEEIIALWVDALDKLEKRDWIALAPRLDWVMKRMAIERAIEQKRGLDWKSAAIKVLDHLYSSLGVDGLYWAYEASGFAELLVTPERIAYFTANPPADTRAWARAMVLRRADPDTITSVDWDAIGFRLRGRGGWPCHRTLDLPDPLRGTEAELMALFDEPYDFEELLDALSTHFHDRTQTVQSPSVS
jgi:Pup amidohydrolase